MQRERRGNFLPRLQEVELGGEANPVFRTRGGHQYGKKLVSIVPKDLNPKSLPLDVRLRRYLIQDTPEQTAEELSTLLAA